MNCLDNESELISQLASDEQISSSLGSVVEVTREYTGLETKDIVVKVDNNNETISATLQKMWFFSFDEFPEIGSENMIYADSSTGILYIYNAKTSSYEKLITEQDIKTISINNIIIEPDENKNINIPKSTSDVLGVVKVDSSVSTVSDNAVENRAITSYVDTAKNELIARIDDLSGEIASASGEIENIEQTLEEYSSNISSMQNSVQTITNNVSQNTSDIATANTEINNIKSNVTIISNNIEILSDELDDKASLTEENTFSGKQNFNGEIAFNGVAEHYSDIKVTNGNVKIMNTAGNNLITYGDTTITKEINGLTYVYTFPTKSGTLALTVDIPTKLSELTNDQGLINNTVDNLVNYYTKTETNALISQIPKFNIEIVSSLPTENISTTTIYLVATEDQEAGNYYEEYIYIGTQWELLGSTKVDLSGYATTEEVNAVDTKVDSANTNITALENNKVDKVTGKELSTNDFTDSYKSQVESNTSARHTHSNKALLDTYTQTETNLADAVTKKHSHSNKGILDNITASYTTEEKNKLAGLSNYDDTDIKSSISTLSTGKQDKLTAGDNITIVNNVISSIATGTGVNIEQTTGDSTESVMSQKAVTDELDSKLNSNMLDIYVGSNDACSDSDGNFGQCSQMYKSSGEYYTTRKFLFDKDDFAQNGDDSEKIYSISNNIARTSDLGNYVPKKTASDGIVKAYVINGSNGEDVCLVSMNGEAGAIARYSTSGQFNVTKDPENANSVTRKIWVQNQLATKVDVVDGKQLSTEDYTTAEKEKLATLENYDDTEVKNLISAESGNRQADITSLNDQIAEMNDIVADIYNVTDKNVVTDASISTTTTQANIALTKTNIQSGTTSAKTISVPSATSSQAGLLSAGDQTIGGIKTFSSDVTIGGNLNVTGTTTTVESTTLQVKDKLIEVAHGNTTSLTTPAGIVAPKYNGTQDGALVFDNTGTAYVGDVTLNSNGDIDVENSDLQALATRENLTDGNLVQWDSSKESLVDSETSIGDLNTSINSKQTQLSTAQLNAVNSGITSAKVSTYDGYNSAINAKYTKPSTGIPKTDLASDVQSSLGKADTALQSHQDISGKQDKLTAGSNITISNNTISAKDTTYSDATTTTSGLMSASDKSKLNGIATGATANTGTITGITMNGVSKGTSGVVDLGTVITDVSDKASVSALNTTNTNVTNLTTRVSSIETVNATQDTNISNLQSSKADKTELPTKTSDLTNDSGFIDSSKVSLGNWTLTTDSSGNLLFNYGGTQKMRLNTSGQLDVLIINLVDSL